MDKEKAELSEAELLAQKGLKINIGKKEYTIKPLLFGTIAEANRYAVQLKLNTGGTITDFLPEYEKNIDPLMKFLAVCILGNRWKIKFLTPFLARKLKWILTPNEAIKLVIAILQMYDIGNFTTSIRLIRETTITAPKKSNLIDG